MDQHKDEKITATGVANFAGQCGECTGTYYSASSPGGMQVGQTATVNGSSPNNCVISNGNGAVFSINLLSNAGFFDYQISVDAQGPSGIGSGSMYLAFEDMTNDVYYLSIYSSRRETHTVSYNSNSPAIKTIYWSDNNFNVPSPAGADAKRAKPDYQVVSPATQKWAHKR